MPTLGIVELFYFVGAIIIIFLPTWKIITKAGFSGWWSIIILIPILNILFLFYFAFTEWPIEKKIK